MLHHLENPSFAFSFMHHFLKDVLQNDLTLDIVCEVLVEERELQQQVKNWHNLSITPVVGSVSCYVVIFTAPLEYS